MTLAHSVSSRQASYAPEPWSLDLEPADAVCAPDADEPTAETDGGASGRQQAPGALDPLRTAPSITGCSLIVSATVGASAFVAGTAVAAATAGSALPLLAAAAGAATSLNFMLLGQVAGALVCRSAPPTEPR